MGKASSLLCSDVPEPINIEISRTIDWGVLLQVKLKCLCARQMQFKRRVSNNEALRTTQVGGGVNKKCNQVLLKIQVGKQGLDIG